MTLKLSIVICTYNRSLWLRNCLESLLRQCKDNAYVEVLIIDNNSTDDTRKVTEQFISHQSDIRYIFEERQGLSHARNRGYNEAKGLYVAYIDDDAKAHPDWVSSIIDFFDNYPDAAGVGGPYYAFSTVPIPDWFPKEFGSHNLGNQTHPLRENEWISGSNMIFKKKYLIELGGFDTELGMTGKNLSYGEETNLLLRMKTKKMPVFYCPDIVVDHAIMPEKLSLRWLLKSKYLNGKDGVRTFSHTGTAREYSVIVIKNIWRALKLFATSKEKYLKARIYRSTSQLLWHLGFFMRLLQSKVEQ